MGNFNRVAAEDEYEIESIRWEILDSEKEKIEKTICIKAKLGAHQEDCAGTWVNMKR